MTGFTQTFGNQTIYPAIPTYFSYTGTAAITPSWPLETAPGNDIVASFNNIAFTASGLTVTLDDASQTTKGLAPVYYNNGAFSYTLLANGGGTILTASAGSGWYAVLTDNTTASGTWLPIQMGAGTSAASASALAGLGLIAITTTLNQQYQAVSYATNPTFATGNRAELAVWTGGAGVATLNSAATLTTGWFVNLVNNGTGAIEVTPSGGQLINSATSMTFNPQDSAIIATNGTAFYTIGFGQDSVFSFDYTSINVAGTGNYVISGTELNRIAYKLTGVLTGNRDFVVPNTVQQYWIDNSTTGAFTLGIRTVTQASPGETLGNGSTRGIFYSNGTDVVNADTSGLSSPVQITQGGTSATSAAGARTNLDVAQSKEAFFYGLVL